MESKRKFDDACSDPDANVFVSYSRRTRQKNISGDHDKAATSLEQDADGQNNEESVRK